MVRRRGKKKRSTKRGEGEDAGAVPRCFVVWRGTVRPKHLLTLKNEFTQVMRPYCAVKLRERRNATLRDYAAVAGPIDVSHLFMFSASVRKEAGDESTSAAAVFSLAPLPAGPTVSFRIKSFSTSVDVRRASGTVFSDKQGYLHPAVVLFSDFDVKTAPTLAADGITPAKGLSSEELLNLNRARELAEVTLKHSFPPFNVATTKLSACKRVVLFDMDPVTGLIQFRHYGVVTNEEGLSGAVTKLNKGQLLNMADYEDVADAVAAIEAMTKPVTGGVVVHDDASGRTAGSGGGGATHEKGGEREQSGASVRRKRVKLVEIGPRMSLELYKVEDGLCDGAVRYHRDVHFTAAELVQRRRREQEQAALRTRRRKEQEKNVEQIVARKKAERERQRKRQLMIQDERAETRGI